MCTLNVVVTKWSVSRIAAKVIYILIVSACEDQVLLKVS